MRTNQPEPFTLILARYKARGKLWLNSQYRRDAIALLFTGLRSLAGMRLAVVLLLLGGFGFWLTQSGIDQPRAAYELVSWVFAVVALIAAAPIYSAEQQHGTLELIWLARGSSIALLRYKATVLLLGVAILALPSVILVSWFLDGELPFFTTFLFLVVNAYLIVAIVAAAGTYVPQAWASTLVAAVLITFLFVIGRDKITFFNFFLNPVNPREGFATGGGAFSGKMSPHTAIIINRAFVLFLASILLSTAAKRMRKTLG